MNIHTPERQPNETQAQYRKRRRASVQAVRTMRCAGLDGGTSIRQQLRAKQRRNGNLRGTYGLGLLQPQRRRNQARMEKLRNRRDMHGGFTLTGGRATFVDHNPGTAWFPVGGAVGPCGFEVTARRIWLAGVSAQRGY